MSRVLLIGEQCDDIFIYGDTPRLSPEGPAPVFIPKREVYNGGMGMNVMKNLMALDIDVDFEHQQAPITKTRHIHESSNTLLLRIDEEKNINVLVLAANSDPKSKESNVIINSLVSQEITNLRVPVMIVPGNFSKDHIALIT